MDYGLARRATLASVFSGRTTLAVILAQFKLRARVDLAAEVDLDQD